MRYLVFKIELAEPAVREVKLNFLGEPALRAYAAAVANDEHADHELRIDRGASDVAVVGLQFLVKIGQCSRHKHIDPAQKMVLRNAIIEAELVKQLALVSPLPTHHRPSSVADVLSRRNHRSAPISTPLSTASVKSTREARQPARPISANSRQQAIASELG